MIYIGSSGNGFTGTFKMAHLNIRSSYVNYFSASSVKCKSNCYNSINSFTQQYCYKCSNFL